MYDNLKNTIIDKTNEAYKDFPESLNRQTYISGNAQEGWHTRDNLTAEEEQARLQESINSEAKAYLKDTDWYITRFIDTGEPIPAEVSQLRQEARERIK